MARKYDGLPENVTMEEVVEATQSDESLGFCMECGEMAVGVEPDARHYTCEFCGETGVFGAEELLIMFGG